MTNPYVSKVFHGPDNVFFHPGQQTPAEFSGTTVECVETADKQQQQQQQPQQQQQQQQQQYRIPSYPAHRPDILLQVYPKKAQKFKDEPEDDDDDDEPWEKSTDPPKPKPSKNDQQPTDNPYEPLMVPKEEWSWASTIWSVVVVVLCPGCVHCAVGALVCNLLAYVDHKTVDYDRKQIKLQCSFWWSTITFLFGLVGVVIAFIVLFGVLKVQDWTNLSNGLQIVG